MKKIHFFFLFLLNYNDNLPLVSYLRPLSSEKQGWTASWPDFVLGQHKTVSQKVLQWESSSSLAVRLHSGGAVLFAHPVSFIRTYFFEILSSVYHGSRHSSVPSKSKMYYVMISSMHLTRVLKSPFIIFDFKEITLLSPFNQLSRSQFSMKMFQHHFEATST